MKNELTVIKIGRIRRGVFGSRSVPVFLTNRFLLAEVSGLPAVLQFSESPLGVPHCFEIVRQTSPR